MIMNIVIVSLHFAVGRKLNAYYEVARQLLERREHETRPRTPFNLPASSSRSDVQPTRQWWEPSQLSPVEQFMQALRRIGCNSDNRLDCARKDEAVALIHDFVFRHMLLQSEEQPRIEPPLFTDEQIDKLYELEKGPFALNDPYLGVRLIT